jgi:hypothetical protein
VADGGMSAGFQGVGLAVPLGLTLWRGKPALSTRCADLPSSLIRTSSIPRKYRVASRMSDNIILLT